jgi:hypothetical protein
MTIRAEITCFTTEVIWAKFQNANLRKARTIRAPLYWQRKGKYTCIWIEIMIWFSFKYLLLSDVESELSAVSPSLLKTDIHYLQKHNIRILRYSHISNSLTSRFPQAPATSIELKHFVRPACRHVLISILSVCFAVWVDGVEYMSDSE